MPAPLQPRAAPHLVHRAARGPARHPHPLVSLLAREGADKAVLAKLSAAATRYIAGLAAQNHIEGVALEGAAQ